MDLSGFQIRAKGNVKIIIIRTNQLNNKKMSTTKEQVITMLTSYVQQNRLDYAKEVYRLMEQYFNQNEKVKQIKQKFKAGDYVFVTDKYGAKQSTKVWGTTKKRVVVENWETGEDEYGHFRTPERYISPEKVVLQSETKK
jgi:pentatricopeptide repeat protein